LKEWNGLISTNIALGRELIVAKDEIAITTNAVAVSAFKLKNTSKGQESYYVKRRDLCIA
jgi:membrane-bound lytic murein transglycosylase D